MPRKKRVSFKKSRSSSRKSMTGHGAYHSKRKSKKRSSKKKAVRGHGAYHIGKRRGIRVRAGPKKTGPFRTAGGILGTALGSRFGMPATGHAIGGFIGNKIGNLFGSGAYKTNATNIHTNAILKGGVPSFDSSGKHCVRVRNKEYCFDVAGSTTTFLNTTYPINPGNNQLFPWLQNISSQFQEYRIEGLVFELRSLSGESVGATNTTLGYWALGTEYNSTLPSFGSKQQLENSEFSVSGPPDRDLYHILECKRSETVLGELFVRTGEVPNGQDQRLYDFGVLNVAVGNQQSASTVCGELHVSYDICFYRPVIGFSGNSNAAIHIFNATGVSTSAYFGTTADIVTRVGSTMSPTFSATTITLPSNTPAGNYMLAYQVTGASTASLAAPTVTYTSGCVALAIIDGTAYSGFGTSGSPTTSICNVVGLFTINAASPVITFSSGTLPGTVTGMDLIITQLPSGLLT